MANTTAEKVSNLLGPAPADDEHSTTDHEEQKCRSCASQAYPCDGAKPCRTCVGRNLYCSYLQFDGMTIDVYIPKRKQGEIGYVPISEQGDCLRCLSELPKRRGGRPCSLPGNGPCQNCQENTFRALKRTLRHYNHWCIVYLAGGHVRKHLLSSSTEGRRSNFCPARRLLEQQLPMLESIPEQLEDIGAGVTDRSVKKQPIEGKCKTCASQRRHCDGEKPCGTCTKLGRRCVQQGTTSGTVKGVPLDQKCHRCRNRERACDGKTPCNTCIASSTELRVPCRPQGPDSVPPRQRNRRRETKARRGNEHQRGKLGEDCTTERQQV
ncbi:hypothetical protein N657DRAFT_244256 [Parathielavia appendiculata]|uniref:Zn(2)-C6 fungal-type domain-containing protein n=1 Tax=Parathielavia appendiculata TaxID=2587402 RepID=A0AAN6TTE8_9PEZI|nr:hypothetical protein N657DRAFT_244256 [Parathielavia appendiculata]